MKYDVREFLAEDNHSHDTCKFMRSCAGCRVMQARHQAPARTDVGEKPCPRCGGTGRFSFGRQQGVCFRCGGSGRP